MQCWLFIGEVWLLERPLGKPQAQLILLPSVVRRRDSGRGQTDPSIASRAQVCRNACKSSSTSPLIFFSSKRGSNCGGELAGLTSICSIIILYARFEGYNFLLNIV
ncbi:hypothetical protein GQ457_07G015270 [Hibiscus cannabinus]